MSSNPGSLLQPQRVIFRSEVASSVAQLQDDVLTQTTVIPEAKISKKVPMGTLQIPLNSLML